MDGETTPEVGCTVKGCPRSAEISIFVQREVDSYRLVPLRLCSPHLDLVLANYQRVIRQLAELAGMKAEGGLAQMTVSQHGQVTTKPVVLPYNQEVQPPA